MDIVCFAPASIFGSAVILLTLYLCLKLFVAVSLRWYRLWHLAAVVGFCSIFLPTKIYPHDYYPSQHHVRIPYANCNSPTEFFYACLRPAYISCVWYLGILLRSNFIDSSFIATVFLAEMTQFPYSAPLSHVSFTMYQWSPTSHPLPRASPASVYYPK